MALLLNSSVCFPRVPRVLAQGCRLVGEDGVEAREAGVLREER